MNKVELLAPAGSFECLKAAINNGANAVYLGGKNFSARAFANNFDENELIEAVKYAHLRNVKIYVTLNTLLNEKEFNNAIKMADFYYSNNVDALLIQDLGLYYYLKNKYPDFELHCSTQMHIHNLEGVRTAKKLGFKRVVLARESTLDFIREACKQGVEIETFVHGAICVSYSGQCLMSSVTKNRSANKGMCAQCCRLKYKLFDIDDIPINTETDYPISPKDMCLVDDIPSLIEAGVSSFKIEGRLKSSAYVGYVTSIYRKAIDSYYEGKKYTITNEELKNLKVLFNRNFTDDYLFDNNEIFGQKTPNHLGIEIGEAFKYDKNFTYIKLNDTLNQFDGIRINDFGCIVNMLYKDDLLVSDSNKGDIVKIKTDNKLIGKVYKTLDYKLETSINNKGDLKLPIDIETYIVAGENVEVTINLGNTSYKYSSNIIPEQAKKLPLTKESITNQFSKLNETLYFLNSIEVITNNAFLPVKQLNEIRRNSIESFNDYRLSLFNRKNILPQIEFSTPLYNEEGDIIVDDNLALYKNNQYDINFVINKDSIYSSSNHNLICEIGGLLIQGNKIAYYTLNCSNSYCYEFLKKLGFEAIILSSELNDNNIKDLVDSYLERNKTAIKPYIFKSGSRVLMYIKANPFDKYIKNDEILKLKDQNNEYFVRINRNIIEILENNDTLSSNILNKQLFIIYK